MLGTVIQVQEISTPDALRNQAMNNPNSQGLRQKRRKGNLSDYVSDFIHSWEDNDNEQHEDFWTNGAFYSIDVDARGQGENLSLRRRSPGIISLTVLE